MKKVIRVLLLVFSIGIHQTYACDQCRSYNSTGDFSILSATVSHKPDLGVTLWEIKVQGRAGNTTPTPAGKLNGAPVLGYVFPTTLKSTDVGFSQTEGIVALALTSHPDFDDSPLWDENTDGRFDNDGIIWHPHWVVLVEDKRVKGGYSVKEFKKGDAAVVLPRTAPDMPMYMDSPGFNVLTKGNTIKVIVPDFRINNRTDFNFDAVTCYMQVSTGEGGSHSGEADQPMLGVYSVYSIASGKLTLPYRVKK